MDSRLIDLETRINKAKAQLKEPLTMTEVVTPGYLIRDASFMPIRVVQVVRHPL